MFIFRRLHEYSGPTGMGVRKIYALMRGIYGAPGGDRLLLYSYT